MKRPVRKKILIADDDVLESYLVKSILEATGQYEVTLEARGSKVVKKALALRPDLILQDIVMPEKEGSEIAWEIKNTPELAAIPIVFMTGSASKDDLDTEGKIGGNPFIIKPASAEEILRQVKRYLPD
ncbi:MAG TPA: response regulator [Candidatus Omnitrophota bacterium]|nr:response regulator [Candidatus Omnitrophota bacterium]